MNAIIYDLFKAGYDTLKITELLGGIRAGWTEGAVYNAIQREREHRRSAGLELVQMREATA